MPKNERKKATRKTRELSSTTQGNQGVLEKGKPRSLPIAAEGVRTSQQFANLMSALMSDLVEGKITAQTSNAVVNAGGKLLKAVELQMKYGTAVPRKPSKDLTLCLPSEPTLETEAA